MQDVKKLAEKAFSEVSEEFVWNCYRHVEQQEEYYKRLLKIDPLPAENIDSWEINDEPFESFESSSNLPEVHFMSEYQNYENPLEVSNTTPENESIEEITIYECEKCSFQSTSVKVWRNHVKTHFECDQCSETFSGNQGKRNYERHMKKHTPKPQKDPKRFQCDKCDKSFKFLSYLKRHREKNHRETGIIELADFEIGVPEAENDDKSANKRKQKLVSRKLFHK